MSTSKLAFEHHARVWLETPLRKRPVLTWILLPFVYLISLVWSAVAARRRKVGYASKHTSRPVLCVGNVAVGGAGKTPFVRMLAIELLKQNKRVAIFARGVGQRSNDSSEPLFVYDSSPADLKAKLTDENREHLVLLELLRCPIDHVVIVQGPDRARSLTQFDVKHGSDPSWYCLMDDGLQHFRAGRDANICMWPLKLATSPRASLPLGPFREGSPKTFAALCSQFDFNIVMTPEKLSTGLPDDFLFGGKEFYQAVSRTRYFQIQFRGDEVHWTPAPEGDVMRAFAAAGKRGLIVTGIVHPERVSAPLQKGGATLYALPDHGALDAGAFDQMQSCSALLCTAKDFCRWDDDQRFVKMIRDKDFWIATSTFELFSPAGELLSASDFLSIVFRKALRV